MLSFNDIQFMLILIKKFAQVIRCVNHHRRIFRSSYRKFALVEFESMTTEFRLDALNNSARPWD